MHTKTTTPQKNRSHNNMSLTVTLSPAVCKTAYKAFGQALLAEIADKLSHEARERNEEDYTNGDDDWISYESVERLDSVLSSCLETIIQKVGKKEKAPKKEKSQKKSPKKRGIRKRFKYEGKDQKGENGAFLRISVDHETRIVSKVNEANWGKKANKRYKRVFGTGTAYIIPAGAGKKAQIVALKPYKSKK